MSTILYKTLFCIAAAASSLAAGFIKTGNVLDIMVLSHPEFSGRFTVGTNGTIEYPLLADESIVNLSTAELMNELTLRLAKHIENPLVLVSIVERPKITVTVLGQVMKPGPVETYLGASLQEVIGQTGGPSTLADIQKVKIIHKNGNDQTAHYFDLKAFMKNGRVDNMPKMEPDDTVILLSQVHTKKVKVIGAVNKPGFFDIENKINVFELIYLAGGPAEKADLSRVRRFYKTEDYQTKEEVLDIQSYLDKGTIDKIPPVEEGDVLIIYSKWFDWKALMTILNNILLFIITIQTLRGTVIT